MSASPRSARARTGAGASPTRWWRSATGSMSAPSSRPTMIKVRLARSRAGGHGRAAIARGGRLLGEVEEYFIETLTPGDTFVFSGEVLRYEALVEDEAYVSRARRRRSEGAGLRGRQVSALDLSGRAGARPPRLAAGLVAPARPGARMARPAARPLDRAERRRPSGRDLPARRQELSRLLSVRGPARAPDARHAADAPARARAPAPARLRRQRICAGGVGAGRRLGRGPAAASPWRSCSTRTCWATTSKPGSPNPP